MNKIEIIPVGHRALIKPVEETQRGRIFIPPTANPTKQQAEGIVLAVGIGRLDFNGTRVPLEAKVGDRVIYLRFSAMELKVGDETYALVEEPHIVAILK